MMSGTSKIWSKSGPGHLLTITKMLQKIQGNMESSWTNIVYVNMGLKKSKLFKKMYVLGTILFACFSFGSSAVWWKFDYIFWKYFCGDEDQNVISFAFIKCTKAWIWVSYLSRTWNGNLVNPPKLCIFKWGNPHSLFSNKGRKAIFKY